MEERIDVQPLPYKTRQKTFGFLLLVFLIALPFLYLYATGYRFDFEKPTNLVSTGGMYVAVDKTGAEIYIDGELVRETRAFRKAFYAQNLDAGTHRVHVQKDGYHTWVKELPVSKHLVTEAEAFNLPLVPQVRVISEWQSATGSMIVRDTLSSASSTNALLATSTTATTTFNYNEEYRTLMRHFASSSIPLKEESATQQIKDLLTPNATSVPATLEVATTTVVSGDVRLYEKNDDVYATWVGSFEQMPYYYCAPEFPPYSTTTEEVMTISDIVDVRLDDETDTKDSEGESIVHPVQTIPEGIQCDPTIRIDRSNQAIIGFDFLPGSTDFIILLLANGIYVVEIDDRAWQNAQPLLMGDGLHMHIENGNIFVYDGTLIYQIILATE